MNEFNVALSPLSGTNLIEASAGTGKTYAISIIFLRLIVENNFRIEEILVVTFTIPATMELRLRIRDRLRDAVSAIDGEETGDKTVRDLMKSYAGDSKMKQRVLTALKSFDQASVYTIHSFCQQMLADNAFESGSLFNSEISNDNAVIELGVADLCRKILYTEPPALVAYFMDNCSAGELLELYKKRPLSTDLRIEPEFSDAGTGNLESQYRNIFRLYSDLSSAWDREAEIIEDIFYKPESLKRNIYKEDSIGGLIDDMNSYIAGDDPLAIFDKFQNYTEDKIRASVKKGGEIPEAEVFGICQRLYNAYEEYNRIGSLMLVGIKKRLFNEIDALLLLKKGTSGMRSFDDLIKDAHRGLHGISGNLLADRVRLRYRAALIDEFQDTDNLQFDIFSTLFNNGRTILFLIGDPKQAIYRFRGADIFSYIKASGMMENRYTLSRNWRSRRELIDAVNCIFGRCENPFVFEKIRFSPVSPGDEAQGPLFMSNGEPLPPLDIWLDSGEDESKSAAVLNRLSSEISHLLSREEDNRYSLDGRKINPSDIAVLVRTGEQGRLVREALSAFNIPSVSRGMDNVFTTEEARALYFILSAISEPSNSNLLKAAVSTAAMGGDADTLYRLTKGNLSAIENELDRITSRFYDYREVWLTGGFLDMITGFLESESVPSRLFALSGGDRMVTNINHISEILHAVEQRNGFTPKEVVNWLGNAIASPPENDEYTMRLERDDDAVNILTMHACKGLEFPLVYCPYLAHSGQNRDSYIIYHDPADNNRPVLYLEKNAPDEVKKIKASEDLAENVRLLYVALTRAMSACRILFAPNTRFAKSAAGYVFLESAGYETAKYSREILIRGISDLADASAGSISFSDGLIESGRKYQAVKHSAENISVRTFTGKVKECWRTQSYSGIISRSAVHSGSPDKDFMTEYHETGEAGEGIFAFTSGARAGLCIHEIFEKTDFTVNDRTAVSETCAGILEKYRFETSFSDILADMFFNVVETVLDKTSGLKLSAIDGQSRLSELEFNFPMEFFDSARFREIFKGAGLYCDMIYSGLRDDHTSPGGVMKGFADLVFESNGKYYIADWKSNHLGNSFSDYSGDCLVAEMNKHNYFLQYYIYTAALCRYLQHRMGDDYSYEKHFGGIYYFFVRGMSPETEERNGVFYDMPDKAVVDKINSYFSGGVR